MRSPLKSAKFLVASLLAAGFLVGCSQTKPQQTVNEYMFWPPAPETPHLQFLTSISTSADVTGQQGKLETLIYGEDRTGDLPFQRPYGIRMFDGQMYICDATSSNVSILDFHKKEVRILGKGGQFSLLKPIDVAVASDGIKYVADTALAAVVAYDSADHYVGKISLPGMRPVALAIRDKELYVSDLSASLIRVFDRFSGKELRTIGTPGGDVSSPNATAAGHLGGAMGLALDPQGNVFVNDVVGCRVQKFTPDGKFVTAIGGIGNSRGTFFRPKHMTIDASGILYVVDNAFQNVQMFNDKNQLLMYFGGPGRHPGAMSMPAGICVTDTDVDIFQKFVHPAFQAQRLVLVTNNLGGSKINVYALGELKPGKTLADISPGRVQGLFGLSDKTTLGLTTQPSDLPVDAENPATQPAATSTQPAPTGPPAP